MRVDVHRLQEFYATPLGQEAAGRARKRLQALWADCANQDVLALGYATPFVTPFLARARRVVAAMPAAQGAEAWRGAVALVDETRLPFVASVFDRIVIVHVLEECDSLRQCLREVWRILAPEGRVAVIAANRLGLWSRADATPFGHGRPFSRGQLAGLLREALLEPRAFAYALHCPPWSPLVRGAAAFEWCGEKSLSPFGGLLMMEAVKRLTAEPMPLAAQLKIARAPRRLATSKASRTKVKS
jgi:SAM-dependent methyltransferase